MSEFTLIDENKYKIVGRLTEEDINRINSFKNRTILILDNTVDLSSKLISKITSDRVFFSIKGGLDYDKKEKYKSKKYIDRTFVSPSGLKKIIEYFEYTENLIDPNWNEFEKAMFLYNALVVDMEYADEYENIQSPKTTPRSLNGILYSKLVCAGFAQVYKEMLDRVGIKNYYQNQRDVHAFNIIEINGKKYGVDVTWDNIGKKNHNGRCNFERFGHDFEFYTRNGHQLYKDIDISDDFEKTILKRVYDTDEEIYDLSVLSMKQLDEYYSHIASRINSRKPFRYNLQNQPLDVKNKYLPVDRVSLKLEQEATKEYPILIILEFLKKRNALQISPILMEAFSNRKGYLLDIATSNIEYRYSTDLSLIGIDNYKIDIGGNVTFENGHERRNDTICGVNVNDSNIPKEDLDTLYKRLNEYLNEYFKKYILNIINNIDELLSNYEYKPDEWDVNRCIESSNIYTKLSIIIHSRDYLLQLGMSDQELDNIIQRITKKYEEVHRPYQTTTIKKDEDLDFLYIVFNDLNMIWKTMEYDLQKQITEEEFIALYSDVNYIIQLFEKYIIIASNKKFRFDEYDVSKEELQELLNKIIQDYKKQKNSRWIIWFKKIQI